MQANTINTQARQHIMDALTDILLCVYFQIYCIFQSYQLSKVTERMLGSARAGGVISKKEIFSCLVGQIGAYLLA